MSVICGLIELMRRKFDVLCAIAKIDEYARLRLERVKRIAERFGVAAGDLYGHITLAVYAGVREDAFISRCAAALEHINAFDVRYARIDVLSETRIIVASPDMRGELLSVQRALTAGIEAELDAWTRPDKWRAHTTLVYSPDADLRAIAQAMRAEFAPFSARVERVEFSRVTDRGYEIINSRVLN